MDFSIKNIKAFYLLSLIEAVNPSFIFSAVDNNKNYWRLKNYFPEKNKCACYYIKMEQLIKNTHIQPI